MKYGIFVGLNRIDRNYYGTDGALRGCVNDTESWKNLYLPDDYIQLLNEEATVGNFTSAIKEFAAVAKQGDVVLINYSGHGTQLTSTIDNEKDGKDEAFCFYDRLLLDSHFSNLVSLFAENVKVIAVFDCCFSGGISRTNKVVPSDEFLQKNLTLDYSTKVAVPLMPLKCSYLGLLACAENQTAMDGRINGLFTETMVNNFSHEKKVPMITWLKESSKKVDVQSFSYKVYGRQFNWKKELFPD